MLTVRKLIKTTNCWRDRCGRTDVLLWGHFFPSTWVEPRLCVFCGFCVLEYSRVTLIPISPLCSRMNEHVSLHASVIARVCVCVEADQYRRVCFGESESMSAVRARFSLLPFLSFHFFFFFFLHFLFLFIVLYGNHSLLRFNKLY